MRTHHHNQRRLTGWSVLSALLLLLLGCMLPSAAADGLMVNVNASHLSAVQFLAEQHGFKVLGAAPGLLVLDTASAPAAAVGFANRDILQASGRQLDTHVESHASASSAIKVIKLWPGVQMVEADQPRYMQRALRSTHITTGPSAAHSSNSSGSGGGGWIKIFPCWDKDKQTYPFGNLLPEWMPYGVPQIQADSPKLPRNITESGVIICVIDSGIDARHPDMQGNILDGCKAQDSIAPAGCPFDWSQDTLGHGTPVAGILAAQQDGQGTMGVVPAGAELHSVRVFNNSGDVNQGQGYV